MNKSAFVKSICNWSTFAIMSMAFMCCLPGCDEFIDFGGGGSGGSGGGGGRSSRKSQSDFDLVKVTINDVDFTFVRCPRCDEFQIPINFNRMQSASIDQDFYIMDSELTVAQYDVLKSFDSELPELSEFNKNCLPSERNNPQIEHKNKPLHGIIPLADKDSKAGLRYAEMICKALNTAINSSQAVFDKDIPGVKTVSIPTANQWYYAAVAIDDPNEIAEFRHFGTVFNRDYVLDNCLNDILLVSEGFQSLDEIQKTYMEKYWQMIWEENSIFDGPFNATPNQVVEILLNGDRLSISDEKEDVNRILQEMPITFLRCLLYDKVSSSELFLYDPSFLSVKEGELCNNWGLYDVHGNASEVVLDPSRSIGFTVMGGHNGIAISQEDNWKQYLLWRKTSSEEIDDHNMPGLRLIFTVDSTEDGEETVMYKNEDASNDVAQTSWFSSPVGILIILFGISMVYSFFKGCFNY